MKILACDFNLDVELIVVYVMADLNLKVKTERALVCAVVVCMVLSSGKAIGRM